MFGKNLIQRINDLISALERPLNAREAQDGWTDESKKAIRSYFEKLREALNSNFPLPALDVVRGMDAWGILGGEIFSEALKITSKLRPR